MMRVMEPPPIEEAALAPVSVFWDIKSFPVPDGYDARLVGPCIKRNLRKLGYTGPITITAVGVLSEVPRDILKAVYSTGISLKEVIKSPTNMYALFLESSLLRTPPPANMMVISRPPSYIPRHFSSIRDKDREKGRYTIFPFPFGEMPLTLAISLWEDFLLADPVALEEEKCSEMGDPASWFCAVCHHFAAPDLVTGRDFDSFITHLYSRQHAQLLQFQTVPCSPGSVCKHAALAPSIRFICVNKKIEEEARAEAPRDTTSQLT
ncbi:NYN domain limkain-b1-type [Arabidopsis suecica]|uniref:NYN domain limkain-b1-type n=1 Tax=Arabidopsis suecica TaxID=45249 RepID=A0A8T2ED73_ARASU|nr:NYN domain limkain-b1-type [Arabidopsis suecica]